MIELLIIILGATLFSMIIGKMIQQTINPEIAELSIKEWLLGFWYQFEDWRCNRHKVEYKGGYKPGGIMEYIPGASEEKRPKVNYQDITSARKLKTIEKLEEGRAKMMKEVKDAHIKHRKEKENGDS